MISFIWNPKNDKKPTIWEQTSGYQGPGLPEGDELQRDTKVWRMMEIPYIYYTVLLWQLYMVNPDGIVGFNCQLINKWQLSRFNKKIEEMQWENWGLIFWSSEHKLEMCHQAW